MAENSILQRIIEAKIAAGAAAAIGLVRMGDFYEAHGEDAEIISKVLGLTLTDRRKQGDATPMCGFPYHTLEVYLKKLIHAGHRVAILELDADS